MWARCMWKSREPRQQREKWVIDSRHVAACLSAPPRMLQPAEMRETASVIPLELVRPLHVVLSIPRSLCAALHCS